MRIQDLIKERLLAFLSERIPGVEEVTHFDEVLACWGGCEHRVDVRYRTRHDEYLEWSFDGSLDELTLVLDECYGRIPE